MSTDTRKIHIIEAVLKTEDENVLSEVERMIQRLFNNEKKVSALDFVGTLSKEDAELMEKAIEESCEQIHPDDSK